MMKLEAVEAAQAAIPNKNMRAISLASCEGRIKGEFYFVSGNSAASKPGMKLSGAVLR
jgi:hypothetical protein